MDEHTPLPSGVAVRKAKRQIRRDASGGCCTVDASMTDSCPSQRVGPASMPATTRAGKTAMQVHRKELVFQQ